MQNSVQTPVIVALDAASSASALNIADQLDPNLCRVKVGKELFVAEGPKVVEQLQAKGFDVFLDLKFHDIPNTVAQAIRVSAELGVWMVNVHALGGPKMMEAAAEAVSTSSTPPLLIAVTILTSMDQTQLQSLGFEAPLASQARKLARLAKSSGIDGVVCSAWEASEIKSDCGDDFVTVTPGIRPEGSDIGDQVRIMTPSQALKNGSDWLVIGRPITQSDAPRTVLEAIKNTLD